jgi:sodium-dependent dicarboxylate transporter 2/3/5
MSMREPHASRSAWRLAAGPVLGIVAFALAAGGGLATSIAMTIGLTAWCAAWWVLEPVHGAVTALLPLALLPLAGILTPVQVAQAYGNELILLLAGGFMLAAALKGTGAHRRLALGMVRAVGGGSGRRLVFGFAIATAALSMWISNTATTLMMLPVALAVLAGYPDRRLGVPLVLAIAYGASIGGMGTPIGTPPNVFFMQVYAEATGTRLGFVDWMKVGVPAVLVLVPVAAWWLSRTLAGSPPSPLPAVGPWSSPERRVLAVFGLTALAWVTRTEPFGGWSTWLGLPGANDASVALIAVVLLSVLPAGDGRRLLDWKRAERIPWGALVLFGGGIALASAFQQSGLSALIAGSLGGLRDIPLPLLMLAICLCTSLLTEIVSNTAVAVLMLPILATTAVAIGVDPALLMLPAVLASSAAFMLPIATAPNLVAYGTGLVTSARMLREGFAINVVGVAVLTAICWIAFAGAPID